MKGSVWQITCRGARKDFTSGRLYRALIEAGIKPETLVEQTRKGKQEILLFPSKTSVAQRLFIKIKSLNLAGLHVSRKILTKAQWQDPWKKGFKPFALTPNIDVVPRWVKTKYTRKKRSPLFIDTNLAFGTGRHETTHFMALVIEECRGQFHTFLDVGTGTGILVVVAHFNGARQLTAIDIDKRCLPVAKANLKANDVTNVKLICVDLQEWKTKGKYDFVAANLITDNLISSGKKLAALVKAGKFLAVSGISLKNLSRLEKFFKTLPFKKIKIMRGKEWAAILYKRQ